MTRSSKVEIDHETDEILAEGEFDNLPGSMDEVDQVSVLSKISISQIGCIPTVVKQRNERMPIALFAGRCTDTKQVEDPNTHKMFTALVGAFTAINFQTGQRYKSGIMYLPDAFQCYVIAALEHSREQPSRRGLSQFRGIEFTYQIDAKPDTNPSGFSYVLKSLMAPTTTDPTEHLVSNALKLLGVEPGQPLLSLPAPRS